MNDRDDFPEPVKQQLARRVNCRCSRRECGAQTSGPQLEEARLTNIGVAAHITAAAAGGPRFDDALTSEQRRSLDNGIWVCQNCAKLIDSDASRYSVEELRQWKRDAEAYAREQLGKTNPLMTLEAKQQVALAVKLIEERRTHRQSCDFERAAACSEQATKLAREAGDTETLRNALQYAARDLGDDVVLKRLGGPRRDVQLSRIASHIGELETLNLPEAEVALEKALLARLEGEAGKALQYAELAGAATVNRDIQAEALVVCLQSYRQMGMPEDGLQLRKRIEELANRLEDGEPMLVLRANWLRTLCVSRTARGEDVREFATLARQLVGGKKVSSSTAVTLIGEVVADFGWAEDLDGVCELLAVALEIASAIHDPLRSATIALQIAEVGAERDDEAEARKYLGIADKWIDILRADGERKSWANRKAVALATRGRVESRLAWNAKQTNNERSIGYWRAAYDAFGNARRFMEGSEGDLVGEVGAFRADLDLRFGEVAVELGRNLEAAGHFQRARSDQVMADGRFLDVGMRAWMLEADALLAGGKPVDARSLMVDFLALPSVPNDLQARVRQNIRWLDDTVFPVTEWLKSETARAIGRKVGRDGLRPVIAEQMRPLVEWFTEFHPMDGAGHAYSELFDIWGRGGFSRVVAALQADPLNAISVDATCVEDLARWARIFCPLYDTVVVNWKGTTYPVLGIVPMPDHLGPPGAFGGQGYLRTRNGVGGNSGWHVAVGWANLVPKDVSRFFAVECLPLVGSGRLVLLPAPLVGCTQSAVGWTDSFLVDNLLGGVVKTAGMQPSGAKSLAGSQNRLHDLGTANIPFIDNVPLGELNRVLDDTIEWLTPLRRLLRGSLGSSALRQERWDGLGTGFTDIREACRELEGQWRSLTASRAGAEWRVGEVTGAFSATEWREDAPGEDFVTDLLRSVAGSRPDLGPWIPLWRLQGAGGEINWTGALDNRSAPPNQEAQFSGFTSPTSQGWLYPGDGGPGMAMGRLG